MKMLTIRQPWASLIALGVKTIETRSWSTSYRGPIAIHAGKERPPNGPSSHCVVVVVGPQRQPPAAHAARLVEYHPLPLGAVVAVADLVDVVPVVPGDTCPDGRHVASDRTGERLVICGGDPRRDAGDFGWSTDQLPFGDFTPGRYAWLLDNARPIDPIPAKGHQGLRDVPADLLAALAVSA